jgi:hypothetical protein
VLPYLVAQRTGEIGIRIALGAQREQVLRLMLVDGLRPAVIGLAIGLSLSAVVTCENPLTDRTYTHCYGSAPVTSQEMKGPGYFPQKGVSREFRDQTQLALSETFHNTPVKWQLPDHETSRQGRCSASPGSDGSG